MSPRAKVICSFCNTEDYEQHAPQCPQYVPSPTEKAISDLAEALAPLAKLAEVILEGRLGFTHGPANDGLHTKSAAYIVQERGN